jgi:hypothetical protein
VHSAKRTGDAELQTSLSSMDFTSRRPPLKAMSSCRED